MSEPLLQLLLAAIKSLVIIFVLLTGFAYMTLFERKVAARIQIRYGPNRVGPFGLLMEGFGMIFPLVRETNQQGAIDLEVMPRDGGLAGREMLRPGRLKAMLVAGRCVASEPDALEALRQLEFLVVQDHTLTETARLAHVVLPGQTFAEKDGTYTNLERRVQRLRAALAPRGEARPDWRIFRDVLNALGGQSYHADADDVHKEIAATVPAYAEVTFGRVGFKGVQWSFPPPLEKVALLPTGAGA